MTPRIEPCIGGCGAEGPVVPRHPAVEGFWCPACRPRAFVVHVKDNIEGAVYIGRAVKVMARSRTVGPFVPPRYRASRWANPYRLPAKASADRRQEVIEQYRVLLLGEERHKLTFLPELRGKPLACWCRHDGEERSTDNACHGDVLSELLDRYTDDELRAMGGGA